MRLLTYIIESSKSKNPHAHIISHIRVPGQKVNQVKLLWYCAFYLSLSETDARTHHRATHSTEQSSFAAKMSLGWVLYYEQGPTVGIICERAAI